jgi:hypothetical protein
MLALLAFSGLIAAGCGDTPARKATPKPKGSVVCVMKGSHRQVTLADLQLQASLTGDQTPRRVQKSAAFSRLLDASLHQEAIIALAQDAGISVSAQEAAVELEKRKAEAGGEAAWQRLIKAQGIDEAQALQAAEATVWTHKLLDAYVENVADKDLRAEYRKRLKGGAFKVPGGQDVFYVIARSAGALDEIKTRLTGRNLETAQKIINEIASDNPDAGQMRVHEKVPTRETADAVLGSRPGQVVGPVRTQSSGQVMYYLFYVIGPEVKGETTPLSAVKDPISKELADQALQRDTTAWAKDGRNFDCQAVS